MESSPVGCYFLDELQSMTGITKDRAKDFAGATFAFLAEWVLFLLLALAATRPLSQSWTTAIPQGTESSATVPMFNLWTLGWNVSRVEAGFRDYWDAPIFYPSKRAFAFSEPQPLMMLFAPILWCGGSLAAAYNIYLWLGLSLTGVVTSRFARAYTGSAFIAWTTGAMMVMLPFVHWQLGVIQLTPLFGIVATIYALARFGEVPTIARSLVLGLSFAITYYLCNYYGLFLSLLLILSGFWLLGRNLWNWRTWPKLLPGAALCLLLIGPMIYLQKQALDDPAWNRDLDYIKRQSAKWGDFTATPWPQVLPIPEFVDENRSGWTLSPGYLKMGLAVLGVIWGLCLPRLRRLTLFLTMFTALGVVLAMGPRFEIFGTVPYETIREHYPGFSKARNVFRFVLFAQIGIVLLAGLGLDGLGRRLGLQVFTRMMFVFVFILRKGQLSRSLSEQWKSLDEPADSSAERNSNRWQIAVVGLGFLAVIEVWPDPQTLYTVPDYNQERRWLTWIEENTEPLAPLACVPFPDGSNAKAYFGTTVWMYYALEHQRPILNGYSGFFPPRFLDLKSSMAEFPDERSFQLLIESGAEYLVVFRGSIDRNQIEQHPVASEKLQWKFSDDRAEIDIYEILPSARTKKPE